MNNGARPNRIRELREAKDISQGQLADLVTPPTSQPQIDRLEKGDRKLTQDWMTKIAKALGVSAKDLLLDESKPGREHEPVNNPPEMVASRMSGSVLLSPGTKSYLEQPRDLPILGSVKAGAEGFFLDQGEIHGMARRPPTLQGIEGAFAVYVHDESMAPAYEPGWIVHVHPKRPCKPGDNVVIEMFDGQAFIKRLVKRTEKHVICKQWNPAGEVKYDPKKVKTIMLVVGSSIEE